MCVPEGSMMGGCSPEGDVCQVKVAVDGEGENWERSKERRGARSEATRLARRGECSV